MKGRIVDSELPEQIQSLIHRCEVNELSFDNDDMSLALMFGEMLWNRVEKVAEHFERLSEQENNGSVAKCMLSAAELMRHVLSDTAKDIH